MVEARALNWLLEPEDPSVRYFTLRHLLGKAEDDPAVAQARAAIMSSRAVERIFSRQRPDGSWVDPDSPYLPKYKATYWTLMLLGYLGANGCDERVRRAVEQVFRFQGELGGFLELGPVGARQRYDREVRKASQRGREPPAEDGFVWDCLRQGTLSCLTGNLIAALVRLGYGGDGRLARAIDWLVEVQNADGGWLCPYWKAHVRDTHGCFYGTICALEGLAEIPRRDRTSAVHESLAAGAEFLLRHHLYRADHHDFRIIRADWLKLVFPYFYGYSILRGLQVLTRLGYRDPRMEDALGVLQEKQTPEGTWILESTPYGRMQANLGKAGEPNKWVTLHALYVLNGTQQR